MGLAIIHTQKGLKAFNAANFEREKTSLEETITGNKSYLSSTVMPTKRVELFKAYSEEESIERIVNECLKKPLQGHLVTKLKRKIKRVL